MKKLLFIMMTIVTLASCERNEVPVYDGPTSVYFDVYRESVPGLSNLVDSSFITFAYTPATSDTTIMLRIRTQGDTSGSARELSIRVIDTSRFAARQDQFVLPARIEIPAGKNQVLLPVQLKKTADMQTDTFTLTLELVENSRFKVPVDSSFVTELGRKVAVKRHTIMFNDILSRPRYWLDGYLGPFSRKKLLLMCDLLDIPVGLLETAVSPGTQKFYGRYMRNYLEAENAAGRTVLEADGSTMKMGDSL